MRKAAKKCCRWKSWKAGGNCLAMFYAYRMKHLPKCRWISTLKKVEPASFGAVHELTYHGSCMKIWLNIPELNWNWKLMMIFRYWENALMIDAYYWFYLWYILWFLMQNSFYIYSRFVLLSFDVVWIYRNNEVSQNKSKINVHESFI